MAGSRVGSYSSTAATPADGSTVTCPLPAGVQAGEYLIAWVYVWASNTNANTWTAPAKWQVALAPTSLQTTTVGQSVACYYVPWDGAATTVSISNVSNCAQVVIVTARISGVTGLDGVSPVFVDTGNGAKVASPTYSPTGGNTFSLTAWNMYPNHGQSPYPVGTWGGGATSDFAQTSYQPNGQPGNQMLFAVGQQSQSGTSQIAPTYSYTFVNSISDGSQSYIVTFKTSGSTAASGHSVGVLYPTPTKVSGNTYQLSSTASAAASNTKISVPSLGSGLWLFCPEQTNGTNEANNTLPAAPASFAAGGATTTQGAGWASSVLIGNSDPGTLLAGTVPVAALLSSSASQDGALGKSTVTWILFVNDTEIGRATSAQTSLPANANTTFSGSITFSQTALPPNAVLNWKVYLQVPATTNLASTVTMLYTSTGSLIGSGAAYTIQAGRSTIETVTVTDSTKRSALNARRLADTVAVADGDVRTLSLARTATDAVSTADSVSRMYAAVRTATDQVTMSDQVSRAQVVGRYLTDTVSVTDASARAITYGRFVNDGPGDYPVRVPTKQIAGVSRDYLGNVLPNCTMRLWREADNSYCGTTMSDANGKWSWVRDRDDLNTYNVTAQTVVNGTQVHGISDRGLAPSLIGS